MIVNTGTTPLARATATHGHAARAVTRPLAVATATENITPANSNDAQSRRRTTPMISATIANWATARTVATTTSRSIPTRPTCEATTARTNSTARATTSSQLSVGANVIGMRRALDDRTRRTSRLGT